MVWEKTLRVACMTTMLLVTRCDAQTRAQLVLQAALQSTEDELHAMSQLAGVIFTGQVVAVHRRDGIGGATGTVEVDFAVEDAIRGVMGGVYTLREWAGLWPAGEQPFHVGQRYLMLLHTPSPGGLSSPVGGADGAIPIRGGDSLPGQAAATSPQSALGTDSRQSGDRTVDLRWIATRVMRPLPYKSGGPAQSTARPVDVRPQASLGLAATSEAPSGVQPDSAAEPAQPISQSLPYASALALMRSWESDAAR